MIEQTGESQREKEVVEESEEILSREYICIYG